MGLAKKEMMEFHEYNLQRYEELKEMNLDKAIVEIDKNIENAKYEISSLLNYDEVEELDGIDEVIKEIKELDRQKSELLDLECEMNELKQQLIKY